MSPRTAIAAAAALTLLAACAPRAPMYHWGRYDENLYRHYKAPQDREAWVTALYVTIRDAEQRGLRVPPGVYAEYGYALLEVGRYPEAVVCFQRERDQWPESQVLMEKMIRVVELRAGTPAARLVPAVSPGVPSATPVAPAAEGTAR